jgi:hypothetical protein
LNAGSGNIHEDFAKIHEIDFDKKKPLGHLSGDFWPDGEKSGIAGEK